MTRSSALRAALLLAGGLFSACAPAAPSTGPAPDASSPARQEIVAANAELVRLLSERQGEALWALFTDEGAFLAPGQRLVRGTEEMRLYVGEGDFEMGGVRLEGVEVETCREQALVRGTLSAPATGGAAPRNWRYAAIWQREGGQWRASMAVLDGPEMERRALGRGCAPASKLERRWIVTAYVYPFVSGFGGAPKAVKREMHEQGFSAAPGGRGGCGVVACTPHRLKFAPRSEADPGDFVVDLRARLRPPVGVEALFSRTPRHKVPGIQPIRACPSCSTQYRHVAATMNTDFAAVAVFYEISLLRIGAGPALARTRWRWESDDAVAGEEWSTTDRGLLLLGGMSLPFGSRMLADVQGQMRLLPDAELPAFNGFSATAIGQSSVVVSIGFGMSL